MPTEFHMQRRVQFAETDLAGIMHFSNYFRWMEECEHGFWRSLELCVLMYDGGQNPYGWPRVSATCDFLAPLRFEDIVDLRLRVVHIGEKSMKFEVEFARGGRPVARGASTAACCTYINGELKSIPIPDLILKKLEPTAGSG